MTSYKIIERNPVDWRDLQELVSTILKDCGFETEVEKTIRTTRGETEVDVYAEKYIGYKLRLLCECKYWESSVPKTIIHAFRTVMSDFGGAQGFIISKKGFQSGAYAAAENTNISLFSWDDFADAFRDDYLKYTIERNLSKGKELQSSQNRVLQIYDKNTAILASAEFDKFLARRNDNSDYLFYSFKDHFTDISNGIITFEQVKNGIARAEHDWGATFNSLKEFFDYIYIKCCEEHEYTNGVLTAMGYQTKISQ